MAQTTYFVVQPFGYGKKRQLVAGSALQAQSAGQAKRMAERYALQQAGAIAFSRSGDPVSGDWDEASIIAVAGVVPEEALDGA